MKLSKFKRDEEIFKMAMSGLLPKEVLKLDIFNMSLALPMYYMLEKEDIDTAAAHLKKALEELK